MMSLAVYLNALHNPFVYDDLINVVDKLAIRDLTSLETILTFDRFRPVVNLSYAMDHALWKMNPLGYHLTSLLLHAINVALLFWVVLVIRRDLDRRGDAEQRVSGEEDAARNQTNLAFLTAVLFAVHPMMTEAVGYISGRAEVLCATFFLAGFLAFRQVILFRRWRWRWLGIGLGLLVLGLGTKELMAMLPFVLLAYDRLVLDHARPEARQRLFRLHLPLIGAVMLVGLLRLGANLWLEYQSLPRPIPQNMMMQLSVVWRYIFLLAAPLSLSVVHQVRAVTDLVDPVAIAAGVALLLLLALAWLGRHQQPLISLGAAWFFLVLAPSSSIVPLLEPMAEHRTYLASGGFFLALAVGIVKLVAWLDNRSGHPSAWPRVVLLLLLAALTVGTVKRNEVWADPVILWQDAVEKAPAVPAPHYALGDAYRIKNNCIAAVPHYRKAIGLLPNELRIYLNLGICLAKMDKEEEAIQVFQGALKIHPGNVQVLNNLGTLAKRSNKTDKAREYFNKALDSDPSNPVALLNLALLAQKNKQWDEARIFLKRSLEQDPENLTIRGYLFNLRKRMWTSHILAGQEQRKSGQYAAAAESYRKAISVFRDEPRQYINLGFCLTRLGKEEEAIQVFRTAAKVDPTNVKAHNNLGELIKRKKKWAEAREHFERALSLAPNNVIALRNLGQLADRSGQLELAARHFQTLLKLDSNQLAALRFMAKYQETRLKRPDRAWHLCRKILRLAPADHQARACVTRLAERGN